MVTQAPKTNESPESLTKTDLVIPCWLCGEAVEVKFSKKDRPYLICNNCGVQTFIRYGKAEELLIARIKQYRESR